MTTGTCRAEVAHLSDQLERAFRGGAWHGPAVLEALDGVDAADAARRPIAGGHTIWELVAHTAAWIEVTDRRIRGEAVQCLPDEEDWPHMGAVSGEAWSKLLERLEESYRSLHGTLEDLADADLERPTKGSAPTIRGLLFGVLQHNVYHAGQIALLRKTGNGTPS